MNVSLYQAAAALNANARWQDVIAENLASSGVPGFKKSEVSFAAVQAGLMPPDKLTGLAQHYVLPTTESSIDFRQGQVRFTGVKTDVAIEGPGFFEVQLPNGDVAYTRDGEFQFNAQGQLVTKQGYAVISDGGPIQFDITNPSPLSIAADGTVSQGADAKGKLKITGFNEPRLLTQIGTGYFVARNPSIVPEAATASSLRQGFVEMANTSSVNEMVQLISAMRHYEANQRTLQIHDERMGRAITELGNPS